MRQTTLLLSTLLLCAFSFAGNAPKDTIRTSYDKGVFTTECRVWVDASEEVTTGVLNDFMIQYRSNLDSLFQWGLKDMNLRGEGDEFIVYNLKSSAYDPETELIRGSLDVIVPKIMTIRDIEVEGKMYKKESDDPRETIVQYDILKATGFVKKADATFKIVRENEHSAWCTLDLRVKFGWFFNIFITQKMYKKNLEWRFEQLAVNLKEESEARSDSTIQQFNDSTIQQFNNSTSLVIDKHVNV